jgi:hypothetical protein
MHYTGKLQTQWDDTVQQELFDMPTAADVILLDYVATLVANGHERSKYAGRGRPYTDWIEREQYREWLVELLRTTTATVLLVTARSQKYREPTMARMREQLGGWMPRACYFNTQDTRPPEAKLAACEGLIFPEYGLPGSTRYMALESNASTRAMYTKIGVRATPVPYGAHVWASLPGVPG